MNIDRKDFDPYEMKLNDVYTIYETTGHKPVTGTEVERVCGGWIYKHYHLGHDILTSTFVPFDNEFMSKKK